MLENLLRNKLVNGKLITYELFANKAQILTL